VVLENQADARARQTANVVTSYIAETAIKMLGLEDLATVNLNIKDIHLDPKAASEAIRASRASYEVGIPVGEMTHVEVSEEVPATVNEALDQDDEEPARDQTGYGLEDAGAMMAALDAQQEPTSTSMAEEPAVADEVLEEASDEEEILEVTAEEEDQAEPIVAAEVPSQEEDDSEPVTPEPLITVEEEGSGPEEMPTVEEAPQPEDEPVIAPLEEEDQVSETTLPPLGEVALDETEEDTTKESLVAEPLEEAPAEEEAEPTTWSIAEEPAPAVEEYEPTTEDQADQDKKKEDGGWGFV
jgi:hypothetical protein